MSSELKLVEYEGNLVLVDSQGSAWMSQKQIGEWLGLSKGAVSNAVKSALESNAPQIASKRMGIPVVSHLETTAADGKRYQVEHYNFLVVSMVAMRANKSENALTFQVWALEQIARSFMAELQNHIENLEFTLSEEQQEKRLLARQLEDYTETEHRKQRESGLYDYNEL